METDALVQDLYHHRVSVAEHPYARLYLPNCHDEADTLTAAEPSPHTLKQHHASPFRNDVSLGIGVELSN